MQKWQFTNGAIAIISEKELTEIDVPVLQVKETELAIAQTAAWFYDFPSKELNLIGITGTNGKTTVTHLIENIFEKADLKCGLIGTLGNRYSSTDEYVFKRTYNTTGKRFAKSLQGLS